MIDVSRRDPTGLILVAADMARERPPLSSSFVSEFARRLQPLGEALSLPMTWIDHRLAESGLTADQLVQRAQREQAADQVSVSNCIGSLRLLDALDWKTFVESVSAVERVLCRDPAHVYPHMNFLTRDMYRHVVERTAREAAIAEVALASKVLEMTEEMPTRIDRSDLARHVGYFLIGDGHADLRERCGLKRHSMVSASSRAGSTSLSLYLLSLIAVGVVLMAPVLTHVLADPGVIWLKLVVVFLAAIGISQLAAALVNRVSAFIVAPRPLPQMDFRKGIPRDARTLVAIPTLLSNVGGARRLVDELEVRYLANRDDNLYFALLTDFADAPEASLEADGAILAAAFDGIEMLNARYGSSRFFLLHRPRQWNERDRIWMGFERKRGKLADLNALLRGTGSGRFSRIVRRHGPVARCPLRDHARQRFAVAARFRPRARRDDGTPAQPSALRRESQRRRRRLRHPAAARGERASARRHVAIRDTFRRRRGNRSVHAGGVRHVSGSLRRRIVHRQGHLRCRCVRTCHSSRGFRTTGS